MQIMCGSTDLTNRLLSYKRKVYFPEHKLIGNAPTAKVDIELVNDDNAITEALLQNTFTITEGSVITGVFSVLEKPQKYTKKLSVELYDNMCKTDIPYKSQLVYDEEHNITILQQLTEMSTLAGVVINIADLPTSVLTKVIGWIDTTYSIRTYIAWIAELAGMNAMCDSTGAISFYDLSTTVDITTDTLSDYSTLVWILLMRACCVSKTESSVVATTFLLMMWNVALKAAGKLLQKCCPTVMWLNSTIMTMVSSRLQKL